MSRSTVERDLWPTARLPPTFLPRAPWSCGTPRARLAAARPGSRRYGYRWPRPRAGAPPSPCGATGLRVARRPVVAILPTGGELRPVGTRTGPGEILATTSLMLATQAGEAGCEARALPIEPDDPAGLARAVSAAVASCDLLVIV